MNRAEKQKFISDFAKNLSEAASVVVANYKGLKVSELQELRVRCKKQNIQIKVAKNRLIKKSLEGKKTEQITPKLVGQLIYAFSQDPVGAPKITCQYAKENSNFKIIAGTIEDTILDEKGVKKIAELPSKEQLRAKIIGIINAPAGKIAGIMQQPAKKIAQLCKAYAETKNNHENSKLKD